MAIAPRRGTPELGLGPGDWHAQRFGTRTRERRLCKKAARLRRGYPPLQRCQPPARACTCSQPFDKRLNA